jgi:hypothetical protein
VDAKPKVLVLAFVFMGLVGCAAGDSVQVETVAEWPEVSSTASSAPNRLNIRSMRIEADDATFVHSMPEWAERLLNDREYVIAGSDERPAFWITYISFSLDNLEPGFFGLESDQDEAGACRGQTLPLKASLHLRPLHDPPLTGRDSIGEFHVLRALRAPPLSEISWRTQPRLDDSIVEAAAIHRESRGEDVLPISRLVCEALARGDERLVVAVVPFDPTRDFRRRWAAGKKDAATILPALSVERNDSQRHSEADSAGGR